MGGPPRWGWVAQLLPVAGTVGALLHLEWCRMSPHVGSWKRGQRRTPALPARAGPLLDAEPTAKSPWSLDPTGRLRCAQLRPAPPLRRSQLPTPPSAHCALGCFRARRSAALGCLRPLTRRSGPRPLRCWAFLRSSACGRARRCLAPRPCRPSSAWWLVTGECVVRVPGPRSWGRRSWPAPRLRARPGPGRWGGQHEVQAGRTLAATVVQGHGRGPHPLASAGAHLMLPGPSLTSAVGGVGLTCVSLGQPRPPRNRSS